MLMGYVKYWMNSRRLWRTHAASWSVLGAHKTDVERCRLNILNSTKEAKLAILELRVMRRAVRFALLAIAILLSVIIGNALR